jgi:hypothetical protein
VQWIFLGLATVQTIYAALTYHHGTAVLIKYKHPFAIMTGFTVLTWAAVGFNYYMTPRGPEATILQYGAHAPMDFYAVVSMPKWQDYGNFRALLIARTQFSDRDRMTDEWIAKSAPYTIDTNTLTLDAAAANPMHVSLGAINSIELNFVVIPNNITPDQIHALRDVALLGGKILSQVAVGTLINASPVLDHSPQTSKQ